MINAALKPITESEADERVSREISRCHNGWVSSWKRHVITQTSSVINLKCSTERLSPLQVELKGASGRIDVQSSTFHSPKPQIKCDRFHIVVEFIDTFATAYWIFIDHPAKHSPDEHLLNLSHRLMTDESWVGCKNISWSWMRRDRKARERTPERGGENSNSSHASMQLILLDTKQSTPAAQHTCRRTALIKSWEIILWKTHK